MAYYPAAYHILKAELIQWNIKKREATANNNPAFIPVKEEILKRINKEIETRENRLKEIETYLKRG